MSLFIQKLIDIITKLTLEVQIESNLLNVKSFAWRQHFVILIYVEHEQNFLRKSTTVKIITSFHENNDGNGCTDRKINLLHTINLIT